VGRDGLQALGSGSLGVVSAPIYTPGASFRVDSGGAVELLTADSAGRLRFTVEMGPSHVVQQYRFGQTATLGWRKTVVTIRPV
jgi:hypothetical protein